MQSFGTAEFQTSIIIEILFSAKLKFWIESENEIEILVDHYVKLCYSFIEQLLAFSDHLTKYIISRSLLGYITWPLSVRGV